MAVTEDINIRLGVDTAELERVYRRITARTGEALANQANKAISSFSSLYQENIDSLEKKYNTRLRKNFLGWYPGEARIAALQEKDKETYKKLIDLESKQRTIKGFLKERAFEDRKKAVVDAFLGVTSAAAGAMVVAKPIKASMEYEKSLTNTAKVYDMTKEQMASFGKELLNLAKVMPVPIEQLGALSYQMAQLGLTQQELLPALQLAVKAGVGLDIPLDEVGQKIGGLKAAFGISMEQLQGALDFINEAANKVSANPAFILAATTRIAPLAASKGITPEQTSAMASVLLNAQWQPETVETGIKDFIVGLTSLYKSSAGDSARAKAVMSLNMDRTLFEQYARTDFMKAVKYFLTSARSAQGRGEKIDAIMYDIFGQQHFGKLLTMLSGAGWQKFEELMDMYEKKTYLGSLEQEFKRVSETAASALVVLQNNLKAVSIAVGDTVLPGVKRLFVAFSKFSGAVHEFAANDYVKPFLGLGTAIAAVGAATLVLLPSIKLLKTALSSIASLGAGQWGFLGTHIAGTIALKSAIDYLYGERGNYGTYLGAGAAVGGLVGLDQYFRKKVSKFEAIKKGVKSGGFIAGAGILADIFSPETQENKAKTDQAFNNLQTNPTTNTNIDNTKQTQYNNTYNDNRVITINNPDMELLKNFNQVVFDEPVKGFN